MPDLEARLAQLLDRHRKVFRMIEAAAVKGKPCPTNPEIAGYFDVGMATASGLLVHLEKRGLIAVERFNHARRVTILMGPHAGVATTVDAWASTKPHWRSRVEHSNEKPQRDRKKIFNLVRDQDADVAPMPAEPLETRLTLPAELRARIDIEARASRRTTFAVIEAALSCGLLCLAEDRFEAGQTQDRRVTC